MPQRGNALSNDKSTFKDLSVLRSLAFSLFSRPPGLSPFALPYSFPILCWLTSSWLPSYRALPSPHCASDFLLCPSLFADGFSDPFVKVEVLGWSKTTRICHRTLFPEFDETISLLVKSSDLLETSLRLSIWDDDGAGQPPDPMGSVEIPLQDLSYTKPIKERMYVVTLDKALLAHSDEDNRLVASPPKAGGSAPVDKGQRVPWPPAPQEGEPGLQFSVELGPAGKVASPDRCVRVVCKQALNLTHPGRGARAGSGPDSLVAVSLAGREKASKLRLCNFNPVWNQTINMDLWSDLTDATLLLEVKHCDELQQHTLLGRTALSLSGVGVGTKMDLRHKLLGGANLLPDSPDSRWATTPASTKRGKDGRVIKPESAPRLLPDPELLFSVEMLPYDASRQCDAQLRVRAVQARNLPALDVGGTSDPYLVLRFEGKEHKTSVIYRTLAPVWRETLVFDTALRDMGTVLEIECFDYDLSNQDDSMGVHRIALDGLRLGDFCNLWCPLSPSDTGAQVHLEYSLVPKRKPGSAAAHIHLSLLRADKLKVAGVPIAALNPYVRLSFEDRVCRSRVVMDSCEVLTRACVCVCVRACVHMRA